MFRIICATRLSNRRAGPPGVPRAAAGRSSRRRWTAPRSCSCSGSASCCPPPLPRPPPRGPRGNISLCLGQSPRGPVFSALSQMEAHAETMLPLRGPGVANKCSKIGRWIPLCAPRKRWSKPAQMLARCSRKHVWSGAPGHRLPKSTNIGCDLAECGQVCPIWPKVVQVGPPWSKVRLN